jgi:hypothetical protein
LAWIGRLPKSRAHARLDELDCFELVVVVDWDYKIDNAVVAINAVETTLNLILDLKRLTMPLLLSRRMLDLIASMLSWGGSSPIRKILFFTINLPVFALTGVAWLVVAIDVVFVMMGVL